MRPLGPGTGNSELVVPPRETPESVDSVPGLEAKAERNDLLIFAILAAVAVLLVVAYLLAV